MQIRAQWQCGAGYDTKMHCLNLRSQLADGKRRHCGLHLCLRQEVVRESMCKKCVCGCNDGSQQCEVRMCKELVLSNVLRACKCDPRAMHSWFRGSRHVIITAILPSNW
jgi:hypothetical protein